MNTSRQHAYRSLRDPIAIVGASCQLPGAPTVDAFWELLVAERDAIGKIPPERFDIDAWYDPTPGTRGCIVSRDGGFLPAIDRFDAGFFGISPWEAARLDPQGRLLLETTWGALEDAGISAERLAGTRTGVYAGCLTSSYWELVRDAGVYDLHAATGIGGSGSAAAGRISYQLNLHGPSVGVEAHCATSLLAVHLACRSLWSGEIELAIVGGANILLIPDDYLALSEAKVLSPSGRCKFGDMGADGYVRSEGVVTLVLKPLSRAMHDNDPIYSVILGTSAVNLGRSGKTYMTPGLDGQKMMLQDACDDAGILPGDVDYIEAHGPGTAIGDYTELTALGQIMGKGRAPEECCYVGSVKSNIGHTEVAAGLAGLLKTSLAIKNRTMPATLHVESRASVLDDAPLELVRHTRKWPERGRPRYAGVSSFGLSGNVVHVVLTEAPEPSRTRRSPRKAPFYLLPLSAADREALHAMAGRYAETLDGTASTELFDTCFSAGEHRTHHGYRLAAIGADRTELIEGLTDYRAGRRPDSIVAGPGRVSRPPDVVFVFSGQGSQWSGMGRELLWSNPVFARKIRECDRAIADELGWSLTDRLRDGGPFAAVDEIQPTLWAIQVALAAVWRDWGIEPDLVIGHSMGEIAAAVTAGALSVPQGAAVVCRRSRLLRRRPEAGAMWSVQLGEGAARAAIDGFSDRVSVGVINSDHSTVLSGDPRALVEITGRLTRQGIFCKQVSVDYASHAPQMEPLRNELISILGDTRPTPASIPMHSTALDEVVDGAVLDARYWMQNLRLPVRFASAIRTVLADHRGVLFIEISPHPVLASAIQDCIDANGGLAAVVPSLRRGQPAARSLITGLATAYVHGATPDWKQLYEDGRFVTIPGYAWQRERFWIDSLGASEKAPTDPDAGTSVSALPMPTFVERVLNQVSEVLKTPAARIDLDNPLTLTGLDSLLAARLRARLAENMDIDVTLRDLLAPRPLGELASDLHNRISASRTVMVPPPREPSGP